MKTDKIYNTTTTHYSISDRLKILIGGKSVTRLEIGTEHEDAKITCSVSETNVTYPDWIESILRKFHPSGYEQIETKQQDK